MTDQQISKQHKRNSHHLSKADTKIMKTLQREKLVQNFHIITFLPQGSPLAVPTVPVQMICVLANTDSQVTHSKLRREIEGIEEEIIYTTRI